MPRSDLRLVLREPEDRLEHVIGEARLAVLKHPVAAQALFAALVAEGRRFAATPEGRVWQERLARSSLVRQGRLLFEAATLNLLTDEPATLVPTQLIDALKMAAGASGLERRLSSATVPGAELEGDVDPR